MDVAIIIGADTRFGDAVCRTLLKMGFRIHALGHDPDSSGYDERFYIPHSYGAGRLAELKGALEEVLESESRLDLLVGLGGPELVTGWEESSPEALVRRLHGCLTEPLLAARVCLEKLKKSKGFLIHGHRRPVGKDLSVFPGYFEDSIKKAYDDLFVRNAGSGLRSARVLYAYPEDESEENPIHQDIAESVSRAFEVILRQKETCIVREISIAPRGLNQPGVFPNLLSAVDPYQTTVLPEGASETEAPILIPTERPKHYVQIAEVKDITDGDVEVPEHYADEQGDELDTPTRQKSSRKRSRRSRGQSQKRQKSHEDRSAPESSEKGEEKSKDRLKDESPASAETNSSDSKPSAEEEAKARRRSRSRKPAAAKRRSDSPETDQEPAAKRSTDSSEKESPKDESPVPKKRPAKKTARKRTSRAKKQAIPKDTDERPAASEPDGPKDVEP